LFREQFDGICDVHGQAHLFHYRYGVGHGWVQRVPGSQRREVRDREGFAAAKL
jgi:hypothetical protein